jgi:hypothetical protein
MISKPPDPTPIERCSKNYHSKKRVPNHGLLHPHYKTRKKKRKYHTHIGLLGDWEKDKIYWVDGTFLKGKKKELEQITWNNGIWSVIITIMQILYW